jgi:hypothetical protein
MICIFDCLEFYCIWIMPSSGKWRRVDLMWTDVPPKRRFIQALYDATSQKTAFFIVTDVKTSNLTNIIACVIIECQTADLHEVHERYRRWSCKKNECVRIIKCHASRHFMCVNWVLDIGKPTGTGAFSLMNTATERQTKRGGHESYVCTRHIPYHVKQRGQSPTVSTFFS